MHQCTNARMQGNGVMKANPPTHEGTTAPMRGCGLRRGHGVSNAGGWTLIELLVVVSLIFILATMGMAQYRTSVIHAREATLKEDLFRMRDAIDQYYADKGQYPSTLDALVSDGYMRKVPDDPFTTSASTWQTVP